MKSNSVKASQRIVSYQPVSHRVSHWTCRGWVDGRMDQRAGIYKMLCNSVCISVVASAAVKGISQAPLQNVLQSLQTDWTIGHLML